MTSNRRKKGKKSQQETNQKRLRSETDRRTFLRNACFPHSWFSILSYSTQYRNKNLIQNPLNPTSNASIHLIGDEAHRRTVT